jgi:hypothetical protein
MNNNLFKEENTYYKMEREFAVEDIANLLDSPKVLGLVANINEGKSNLIYYIINELQKVGNTNIASFGLKKDCGELKINSIAELENITGHSVFIDELPVLFDLENRKEKRRIENTLRLIAHNNNILVLCGLPENFKKFLSGKINHWLLKKITIDDAINGSSLKKVVTNYHGVESGSEILNINKDEMLLFDGKHYKKYNIPYLQEMDTKKDNKKIVEIKNVPENVSENVSFFVEKNNCSKKCAENVQEEDFLDLTKKDIPKGL